ncbi:gluconolactonase [Pedobacter sp. UYP30]|uniref:SMP-30/gluconolactonase/LRE family protein n=1 Tax=Pedobacter sp. UYP30 TaxID=1756400 RepID=UPI0033910D6E
MKKESSTLVKSNQKEEVGSRKSEIDLYQLTANGLAPKLLTSNRHALTSTLTLVLAFLLTFSSSAQTAKKSLFNQDSLVLISNQFRFTEGASVDRNGNIFLTDQPNNKIWEYNTDGKLSVFLSPAGRANGTIFDKKGNLIVCADEHNQLWSVDKHKNVKVLLSDYQGKNLNGPNDIWIDAKGGIFFTDPYYQRDYWTRKSAELPNQSVYYVAKNSGKAVLVADGLNQPNGIVGTPDGKFLYISDIGAGKTYRYAIAPKGKLTGRKLIVSEGSDGMVLDAEGNIYLSGKGVNIFDKEGTKIRHINVPEDWVGNLCFGGKNKDVLFITASKSLYKIKMAAKGVE